MWDGHLARQSPRDFTRSPARGFARSSARGFAYSPTMRLHPYKPLIELTDLEPLALAFIPSILTP